MTSPLCHFVFLPGVDNSDEEMSSLARGLEGYSFDFISYPGWRRYVAEDFSLDVLAHQVALKIARQVPSGPIRIVGYSIGGHLGYCAALHLQSMGREVATLCVIDSFMPGSASSLESPGNRKNRILAEVLAMVRAGRLRELSRFVQSKFWRALFLVAGERLKRYFSRTIRGGAEETTGSRRMLVAQEWGMYLLQREAKPWLTSLDRTSVPLNVPAIGLRTAVTSADDDDWRQRCPQITFYEVLGQHHELLQSVHIGGVRDAFASAARSLCEQC